MTQARTTLVLTFAAGILLGVLGMNFSNAQDQSVKRTGLLRVDLASVEGREAIAYIVDLAPGAGISKHSSHGDEFVYILEGAYIVEVVGKWSEADAHDPAPPKASVEDTRVAIATRQVGRDLFYPVLRYESATDAPEAA